MKFNLKNKPEVISRPFSRKPWCNPEESAEWFEGFQKELEEKMNVIIRIKSLKVREHFARRLNFEILGYLIGGHVLPDKWKEEDWLPENLPAFLGKKKVKEIL